MALPLEKYSVDENSQEGIWVLLESDEGSPKLSREGDGEAQEHRFGRVRTTNVRNRHGRIAFV